jgi:hypothetical protein
LDFLGFSRPKRDLSMGYTRFSLKNFSRAPFHLSFEAAERKEARGLWESTELSIEQAYARF